MGRASVPKIHLPADLQPGRGAGAVHGLYREQAEKYGYTATPQQLGWAVPIYVADSDAIAYREAKPHIESFYNKFARMPQEMLLPPGYLSLASMQALVAKSKASLTSGVYQTIDDVMRKGIFLCGSADTVCDLLTTYQQKIGFGHLICLLQFGTLPADLTRRNLELFARKVMPRVRHPGRERGGRRRGIRQASGHGPNETLRPAAVNFCRRSDSA